MNVSYVIKYYPREAPNQVLKDHEELPEEAFHKPRCEAWLWDCQANSRSMEEEG